MCVCVCVCVCFIGGDIFKKLQSEYYHIYQPLRSGQDMTQGQLLSGV